MAFLRKLWADLGDQRIEFRTRFSPERVYETLSEHIDRDDFLVAFGRLFAKHEFLGWLERDSIRLRKRGNSVRNAYQPYLIASLSPQGRGTVIKGRLGVRPSVRRDAKVWLCLMFLGGAMGVCLSLQQSFKYGLAATPERWLYPLITILAPVFALGTTYLNLHKVRDEAQQIRDFVEQTLQATIVHPKACESSHGFAAPLITAPRTRPYPPS